MKNNNKNLPLSRTTEFVLIESARLIYRVFLPLVRVPRQWAVSVRREGGGGVGTEEKTN